MQPRERCASRTTRATYRTQAPMGAIAKRMPLQVASRRRPLRAAALRKLLLIRMASRARSRPEKAQRTPLPTRAPRRQPKRVDRVLRTRQRSVLEGSAQPQQRHPLAVRRKHNVRRADSRARQQPTAGPRKPLMMLHLCVPPAQLPARRRCKAPAATADSHGRGFPQQLHNRPCNPNLVAFAQLISARLI